MHNMLVAALSYADREWAVLPLHGLREGNCTCGKSHCHSPGKHPLTANGVKDATSDAEQIRAWWDHWPFANIGIATGDRSGLVVLDIDGEDGEIALQSLGIAGNPHVSNTGRGRHLFFAHSGIPIRNRTALAPKLDVRGDNGYVVAPPSRHVSGATYQWATESTGTQLSPGQLPDKFLGILTAPAESAQYGAKSAHNAIVIGERNNKLTAIAGSLFAKGLPTDEVLEQCLRENELRCLSPLPDNEVFGIVRSIERREFVKNRNKEQDRAPQWPANLAKEAFYGLAGEIVELIAPQSESDPAALLSQFLVVFGNAAGRNPHSIVEADRHGVNAFLLIVGKTGKGRKGTSLGHILRLFREADPNWFANNIKSGLSSGEGLIYSVRDAIEIDNSARESGNSTRKVNSPDMGIADKRLLLRESEFAGLLKIMSREGNTVSPVVRLAWDCGDLQIVNKNSPIRASDAHISIIGHITGDELKRHLKDTEIANGFLNRFLLIGSQRSKLLPEGGAIPPAEFSRLAARLNECLANAAAIGLMVRCDEARELWRVEYSRLSADRAGLFGAVTSRAEAHVQRLSCIYALLDRSPVVEVHHLRAALAVWEYAENSAAFLFGRVLGDPIADELLRFIRETPNGVSQTAIRDHFARHNSKDIHDKLHLLAGQGQISCEPSQSTGGRPAAIWRATKATE